MAENWANLWTQSTSILRLGGVKSKLIIIALIFVAEILCFNDILDIEELDDMKNVKLIWDIDEDVDYTQQGDNWPGLWADGKSQSPIDIEIDRLADLQTAYLEYSYPDINNTNITHKHDKLDTNYTDGYVKYEIDNKMSTWDTIQFHFHAPSEHTVNSKQYGAEMHFRTHISSNESQILTFAIFLEEKNDAEDNQFFEQLKLSTITVDNTTVTLKGVNLTDFFKPLSKSNILKYEGSRTRPPWQEDTQWLVMRETIKINPKQLNYFNALWKGNPGFANGNGNNRRKQSKSCIQLTRLKLYLWLISFLVALPDDYLLISLYDICRDFFSLYIFS